MKLGLTISVLCISSVALFADAKNISSTESIPNTSTPFSLKNDFERRSYAVGMTIADSFKNRTEFNGNLIAKGIEDTIAGTAILTDTEKEEIVVAFQKEVQSQRELELKKEANQTMAKGKAFLETNKSNPGVITTESGLQYKVISRGTEADAKSPKSSDTVTVHYRGTLIDGTEFDSSYRRNQPASFPLNGVIKGWTEGLQYMKTGDKFEFYIPSELAYGDTSAGIIGANSVLVFEVELLKIVSK